ncbi:MULTISPECIES: 50S ribosomal protein L17 [Globicatella]|uniref:Large ribosomal subunit protein bL17 n=2 Tax=Globicatella sulfidifaciens TaxID=136093 RepID=A0A1T4KCV2_9LACT|nr:MULTISPECIES: 50S ribosomal protein L17 [Globicatella]MDT2768325.1 50S ribosomal protein L17 [Globicatella sulfidifaciens]NLJ18060.1 50S ribosomal protein L17 [Globicatella sulfidifaciens]WPC09439.1 50S ribosomal protein L17 [Globicatella sp. PHS-GS-PNBC-21-1553]SJZ40278.1 LSU ribosomal protein L17P [Globicatella sulfidifaciens DSM 15739]HJF16521.1 50S ribosomal protein L17 [Globicatella sulfidifaciens]
MAYRKLGRKSAQRKALLRDLTTDVLINERIETTEARAKEVRKFVDKMITLAKRGDLASRRQAAAFLRNEIADARIEDDEVVVERVLQRLFDTYATRYEDRNGGYTRILKKGPRRGDGAPVVILELV